MRCHEDPSETDPLERHGTRFFDRSAKIRAVESTVTAFARDIIESRTQATLLCAAKFSDDCGDSMM
jgi:hypothetical protein